MKKEMAAAIIISAMILSGCASDTGSKIPTDGLISETSKEAGTEQMSEAAQTAAISGDAGGIGESIAAFNWKLFGIMAGDGNLFYSPYSIESALAMADAGAAQETKAQMEKVLGIDDLDEFLSDYYAFRNRKQADTAKLTTANSLWIDEQYIKKAGSISSPYADKISTYMGTEVYQAGFSTDLEKTLSEITKWVKDNTGDMIPDYKASAEKDSVIDIINAVYFYGEWQTKFSANDTSEQEFRGRNSTSRTDMMYLGDVFLKYYSGNGFRGLEMPYDNSSVVMDLILTDDDSDKDIGRKWAALDDDSKGSILQGIDDSELQKVTQFELPKFTMDITADKLADNLKALGMEDAFDPALADFSGIAKGLYISDINHRSKIEVDEEGSRAAAVTEVVISATSIAPEEEKPLIFNCDHPFIFVIRDTDTGVILFTGMVNDL